MDRAELIAGGARAIASLGPATSRLEADSPERADVARAVDRGYFTPEEDERVHAWFARYLTARAGLLETIDDLRPIVEDEGVDSAIQIRAFVIAYTAACLLVRGGRFLVSEFATHKLVQRKLNEAEPRFRIPRRQYTAIRRAITDPVNAWRLHQAVRFAREHREDIDGLDDDPELAVVLAHLREAEDALDVSVRYLLKARLRYRWHSLRRRRATAVQRVMFALSEGFGRLVADLRDPRHANRLGAEARRALDELLEPGDVLITRHDTAMSNLFLPGFWPHASLHIGTDAQRDNLGVTVDDQRAERWSGPKRILEARKDGVLFRELDDTLAVDAVAVIRPRLSRDEIARAITQVITHEGKLYNFDFDFFTADRLVCTEVVYRAYDGFGSMRFELKRRAGRLTLSAEDLLDMAVDDLGFQPVAVFGSEGCPTTLVTGPEAAAALAASYRSLQP